MQHTDGKRHWHGDHPKGLANAEGIEVWRKGFTPLAAGLARNDVEVINASPETALTCFKRMSLDEALRC